MKKNRSLTLIFFASCAAFAIAAACKTTPPAPEPPPPPPPAENRVDTSPPVISVSLSPQPFSPDGDGIDDELLASIHVTSASEIKGWQLVLREPVPPYNTFVERNGEGAPPEELVWGGLSDSGELVQSASSYPFEFTVSNMYSQAVYRGTVDIDVLVRREGGVLRVIVPSILFAPNSASFTRGVDPITVTNNERILQRIAVVLNQFSAYGVKIEGHANPTTAPGTQARATEEYGNRSVLGLQPLSEQRAKAVLDYLAEHGVERGRLSSVGAGGSRPIVEFADRDNWWKNRRVVFILEK